nr:DUF72 domain-containing protein [Chloroflexota bacterium]
MSRFIHIGCCGFPVARSKYYECFSLVEVQETFYRPPRVETAQAWRQQAPADFEFTLKAWQLITHEPRSPTYRKAGVQIPAEQAEHYGFFRATEEVYAAWDTTLQVAQALHARVVVFQCPPSFTPTEEHVANLQQFFSRIERRHLLLAWEPRGGWPDDLVAHLCQDLNLIHCVDPFQRLSLYGEPTYYRLHGIGGYRYLYTQDDLVWLLNLCKSKQEVYCLFNNVQMWQSAQEFLALTKQSAGSAGQGSAG